jgi:hypothetical protein
MSFDITFMHNTDPVNKISKNPSTVFTLSGTLKNECDITDPIIRVQYENPLTANYAYIAAFSRYYYIRKITQYRTNLWDIEMHCDVLKTFSEGILGSPCIASKSSSRFNLYINDDDYKCQQNDIIQSFEFPSGFDLTNSRFYLMLTGQVTNQSS